MSGLIQRTQYRNVSTGTIRTGATGHGESVTDVEDYLQPMDEARAAALLGSGVAIGLEVVGTAAAAGVRVRPGVAIDRAGRTVALLAGGVAVVVPELEPGQVVDVPRVSVPPEGVVVDTAGREGDFVVTVTWQEAQDESALANAPVLLHAPWLRLVPKADFDADGDSIALAQVSLDTDGVTTLDAGPRQRIAVRAGRLELGAVDTTGDEEATAGNRPLATLGLNDAGELALDLIDSGGTPTTVQRFYRTGHALFPKGITTRALLTEAGDIRHKISSNDDGVWALGDDDDNHQLTVDAVGNVGIGIADETAQRILHIEGSEVHSGGGGGGFSFADRRTASFVDTPGGGQRWVWYGLDGAAHLWSGFNRISISASGEGGGLDVGRRMRVRQGGDGSAGIWLNQDAVGDRAFMGMSSDSTVGFYGTGCGWQFQMHTATGELTFGHVFGNKWSAATLNLWGSTISDVGGGTLSIRSGGGVVAFDGDDAVVVNKDLHVRGRIFKGGGGFKIDHPLAPDDKFLAHSFVESPEMATFYTGTATIVQLRYS